MKLFQRLRGGEVEKEAENVTIPMSKEQYLTEAQRVLDVSWAVLHSSSWQLEKETSGGDSVHSTTLSSNRKVFKAKGIVEFPPQAVLELMFNNPERFSKWNPVIVESHLLQHVDENTHVSYQVTAERVGGLVSRRDFVVLSHWEQRDSCYVLAGASIQHPNAPVHKKYIRGENGPSCWVMKPVTGCESHCEIEWYLNTNLRGWLPQYVVDAAFSSIMIDNLNNLRAYTKQQTM